LAGPKAPRLLSDAFENARSPAGKLRGALDCLQPLALLGEIGLHAREERLERGLVTDRIEHRISPYLPPIEAPPVVDGPGEGLERIGGAPEQGEGFGFDEHRAPIDRTGRPLGALADDLEHAGEEP